MKFGTSGLRGLVTDLQGHASALYTTAFAHHLVASGHVKAGDTVYVGRDYRGSSPDIAATAMGALQRAGLIAVDCGPVPTPALALYAMSKGSAALMVTGSHIPADRNGIKFYRPDGEIDKNDEGEITRIAAEIDRQVVDLPPLATRSEETQALDLFLSRNRKLLPAGALAGLKIGVYQHSTVARDALVDVVTSYGAHVVALGRSDQFIPVDTEAVSADTVALLTHWAQEHDFDAIISADGDGDRPLVTDETGMPVRGDLLGLVAARFLRAETVVTPVTSNSGIEAAGDYQVIRTKVGSPFVIDAMNTALADGDDGVMGFEANGGVLTATDFALPASNVEKLPTRDSFLPILAMLFLIGKEGKPLSAIAADFRLPVAVADRLENVPTEHSAALMAHLRQSSENLAGFLQPLGVIDRVSDIDGLRVTFSDRSILHLRPSGNAPEMRCYVEAQDEASAEALLVNALALVRNWLLAR